MLLALLLPLAHAVSFTEGSAAVGLSYVYDDAATWGDYDNDGWPDLFAYSYLWHNLGGTFELVPDTPMAGRAMFGDVDNDGDQDLFTWYGGAGVALYDAGADSWSLATGAFETSGIVDSRGLAAGDFDGDGFLDLYIGAYESNGYEVDELYLAGGDTTWSRTWTETGAGPYFDHSKPGRGVTACDFDEDGDLDVYVSNYRLEANNLWLNDGTGNLEDSGEVGVWGDDNGFYYSYGHTIGSSWGDLDGDGDFDLFVGNFSHPYYYQDPPKFLENLGAAGAWEFADRSADAGLAWQESYASPALGDYDNDGYLDLYFTTVYAGDYPVLYRNNGDWSFTDKTASAGLSYLGATYQASWVDFDRDGDLDLLTAGGLWINDGVDIGHYLLVTLVGDGETTNRSAIGAQVRVDLGDLVVTRQVEAGTGEGNGNDLTLHLGLGYEAEVVDVVITWPDGSSQTVEAVEVDQHITVEQCSDGDGDGVWGFDCGGTDCDDSDASIYPGAPDEWYDGIDSDCAGDEDFDADLDGVLVDEDCDDTDASVYPGAPETWYDGVDSDCGYDNDYDQDLDGHDADFVSGTDCDDTDPAIHAGAEDVPYDGVDADCQEDSDFDADWDGYDSAEHGGTDCDDANPRIHPAAKEVVGNGIDEDCDGVDADVALGTGSSMCATGGGGSGWLLGLALLGWRRRSSEARS